MAVDSAPLNTFKTLVNVQKANGVKLIEKTDSGHVAREFVHELAQAIREKITSILTSCKAFSCLTDGTQARKTGAEKELVLIRILRKGEALYFLVALADVDSFGDATAATLKTAIDASFTTLGVEPDSY